MNGLKRLESYLLRYRASQCLLFVGAGFSKEAKIVKDDGSTDTVPSGKELAEIMKFALNEETNDLSALASVYVDEFGEHGLFDLLKRKFVVSETSNDQKVVAKYNWRAIYTTNYDNVIEVCCASQGIKYSTYTSKQRPSDIDGKTLPIVHINGFIAGANFNDFLKEIKLSEVQYYTDDFSRSKWGTRFRNDVVTSPCIVFAGYSLFDLDVARILNEFEGMNERVFFVLKEEPSRAQRKKLEQFGEILTIGLSGLSSLISRIQALPQESATPYFSAWEQLEIAQQEVPPSIRDIDVVNFFMAGNLDSSIFANEVVLNSNRAIVNRTVTDQVTQLLTGENCRNVVLNSNIGNGKTATLDAIGYKLAARNYTVLRASASSSLLFREVAQMKGVSGRLVLLIDDVFSHLRLIESILAVLGDGVIIVASARTSQLELQEGELRQVFGAGGVEIFELNRLDSNEVSQLIKIFDEFALWGARQSDTHIEKRNFLERDCGGELRTAVLHVLNSPNIQARIREIINFEGSSEQKEKALSVVVTSQLLNLADIASDLVLIGEMLKLDARAAIREQESRLRDFTLVRNGKLSIKSALFSEYVLSKLIDTAFVVETMTKCMENLDDIYDNDEQYKSAYKNFSRYRLVESAIAPEKHVPHMIKYFENIKVLSHCRETSLFWLQYAMCRITFGHFKDAERLLDVAYSFSKKSGFLENRHLDNQFARFLLSSRTLSNDYTDFSQAFNKAHAICLRQMRNELNSKNPYRVASLYRDFVDRRAYDLDQGGLLNVFRSCSEILALLNSRSKMVDSYNTIENCKKAVLAAMQIVRTRLMDLGVPI